MAHCLSQATLLINLGRLIVFWWCHFGGKDLFYLRFVGILSTVDVYKVQNSFFERNERVDVILVSGV